MKWSVKQTSMAMVKSITMVCLRFYFPLPLQLTLLMLRFRICEGSISSVSSLCWKSDLFHRWCYRNDCAFFVKHLTTSFSAQVTRFAESCMYLVGTAVHKCCCVPCAVITLDKHVCYETSILWLIDTVLNTTLWTTHWKMSFSRLYLLSYGAPFYFLFSSSALLCSSSRLYHSCEQWISC